MQPSFQRLQLSVRCCLFLRLTLGCQCQALDGCSQLTRLSLYLTGPGQSSGKQLEVKSRLILGQVSSVDLAAIVAMYPNVIVLDATGERR